MENYITKVLPIGKLIVNPENFRFNPVENQEQAIVEMVIRQGDKLIVLIEDILKNGLNPTDLCIVFPRENNYIVLEGNRRITSLKLISNPKILKNIDNKLYTKLIKLLNRYPKKTDQNITCIIPNKESEADKWIKLKHTGENNGKGAVRWDNQAIARFNKRVTGKEQLSLQIINFVKNSSEFDKEIKKNIDKVSLTNIDRLISDPIVRETIGLKLKDKRLLRLYPNEELKKPLTKILNDLINKNIVVTDIYTKDDRIDYMSSFDIVDLPEHNKKLEYDESLIINLDDDKVNDDKVNDDKVNDDKVNDDKVNDDKVNDDKVNDDKVNDDKVNDDKVNDDKVNDGKVNDNKVNDGKVNDNKVNDGKVNDNKVNDNKNIRDTIDINKRKYLIPGRVQIKIYSPRINQIYKELKKLEVDKYPNSVSVLFRVFIELIVDNYINKNDIKSVTEDSKLNKKVQECLTDLKNKNLINKNVIKPVNIAISNPDSIISINTFNSYVHNSYIFPDPIQLKNSWNNLSTFLIALLNNSN
ncbi:hypothetical protein [Clostridium sporogenes]|uniref:hypothetical protein n=1 Tax=Clostridium sporogenes TaxID=1509 RepID=UPI0007178812|nr:hypothetical protein [Clostridium sporogenes]KRU42377.1 hypothetical protein VT94_16030 [Clostridium sporogenes]